MKNKIILLGILPFALSATGCNQAVGPETIEFDYIFTAQPVISATNSTIFKNVQEDFNVKSEGKRITQASIFVKNGADHKKVCSFLDELETAISEGLKNPSLIKSGIESIGEVSEQQNKFGVPGGMAMKVTAANNGFSLGFSPAEVIKDEINSFVNLLTNNTLGNISDDVIYPYDSDEHTEYDDLKILASTGAPAVALYSLADNPNFETTTNPKEGLIPQFKTNNYDVIVAPTQGGLTQIIKQNAEYKIAATITFGNFYIVSTGRDEDQTLNEGDKVLIFQEEDIPGKVFKYTYGDLKLDITAVAAVSDTKLVIENNGVLKK